MGCPRKGLQRAPHCPKAKISRPQKAPVIFRLDDPRLELYALGDIHGAAEDAFALLQQAGLAQGSLHKPIWTGDKKVLVVAGDLINKGDHSIATLDLVMTLQAQAAKQQGRVVALLGNHEVGFLAAPYHPKFEDLRDEIKDEGLRVCEDVHGPKSRYGRWLRARPIAALINGVLISHAGPIRAQSLASAKKRFLAGLRTRGWDSEFSCGAQGDGFFTGNHWWEMTVPEYRKHLQAVGAKQILFAHDPRAFNEHHVMRGYFGAAHALIKLDMEMVSEDSAGTLYKCARWAPAGGCAQHERLTGGRTMAIDVRDEAPPHQRNRKSPRRWCVGR